MNSIRCIVLEDEEPAQNLIRHYAKQMPEIEIVEYFYNAIEASNFLQHDSVDLIITDIDMPRLTGIDFIKMLSPKPLVIIITAYPNYAAESYDLEVTDYMVKPVTLERFKQAIEKVNSRLSKNESKPNKSFMYVKEDGRMIKIELDGILYVEGMGDYVKIITQERVITSHLTMSKILETLPPTNFMRVHKSFIINTDKISSIDSANSLVTMKDKKEITLGRTYKSDFLAQIKPIN